MTKATKYFIGFEFPNEHHDKLVKAQQRFRHLFAPTTKVLSKDDFHVTVLFLGAVPLGAAEEAMDVAWGNGGVPFRFDGLTVFRNQGKPNALVLKLHDIFGNAQQLHTQCVASAPTIGSGKRWPYNPHATLAKCDGPPDEGLVKACDLLNEGMAHNLTKHEFTVRHLCLYAKADGAPGYTPHKVIELR